MNRFIPAAVAIVAAVLAAILIAPGVALGRAPTGDGDLAARVRDAVGDTSGRNGLAVATVEDGRAVLAGLGEDGGGRPVGADTLFEPGSVTKTWTAMLFADMVDRGEVGPADTLGDLLPGREFADPAVAGITLAELASHRSGLPSLAPRGGLGNVLASAMWRLRGTDPYAGISRDDVLDAVAGYRLRADKGTVRYSNFGMAVLGHALAERAGRPYDRLVTDRVLRPAGMTDTVFRPDGAAPPPAAATGGTAAGRPVDPWTGSGYQPAGVGGWTSASDLAAFLAATVAGTAPGAAAVTPRFAEGETSRIGYGWFTTAYGDRAITWHNGATGGFSSYVAFEPATGRGVVVLGNTDRGVEPIGLALLGVSEGPGTAPERDGLFGIALTLALLLAATGPVVTLAFGGRASWLPAADRLRLVSGIASGVGLLAVAYVLGAWLTLPGLLWAVVFGVLAGAVAAAALRWRSLPTVGNGRPWVRWTGAAFSVAFGALLLALVTV
jgi:CubicO group peptidase (beta-lactamase class C family)